MTHQNDLANAMNLARSIMDDCAKMQKSPKGKTTISKALHKKGFDGNFEDYALANIIDVFEEMMYADRRPFPQALEMYDRLQFLKSGELLDQKKSERRFRDTVRGGEDHGVDKSKYVPDFFNVVVDSFGADSGEVKDMAEKWLTLNYMFRQPDIVGPEHDDSAYKRVWYNTAGAFHNRIKELNRDIVSGIKRDFAESEKERKAKLKRATDSDRPSIKDRVGKGPQPIGTTFNGASKGNIKGRKNMPVRKPDPKLIHDKLIKPNSYGVMRSKLRSQVARYGDEYADAKEAALQTKVKPKAGENFGNPMSGLDHMVGLNNIKKDVKRLRAVILRQEVNKKFFPDKYDDSERSLHMIFTGNPGTGKTTVAEAIGQLYKDLGVLKKGHVVKVERKDLCGEHIGKTAPKTQAEIDKAIDGILFVDEAYSLYNVSENDYGREAAETILTAMESERDRLVVIFAGYPDEMRDLIHMNPGLLSRFNKFFNFEDYTTLELGQILDLKMEERSLSFDDHTRSLIMDGVEEARETLGRNFGNARFVRNFVEKVEEFQADRLMDADIISADLLSLDENDPKVREALETSLFTISADDVQMTLEAMKDAAMGKGAPEEKQRIGFHIPQKHETELSL